MSRGVKILVGIVGGLVLLVLIGMVLCTILSAPVRSSGPEPAATAEPSGAGLSNAASAGRHPFSVDLAGGDGAMVSWQGYADGHQPGTAETMHLAINSSTGQAWNGRFCVQLLEPVPSSVVIPLAEQEFSLESDGGFSQDVRVELPADLTPGSYGLALVVREPGGPIVDVVPVQVGEGEAEPFQGDWPTEAALDACPAR